MYDGKKYSLENKWEKILRTDTLLALKEVGLLLSVARKLRSMSVVSLAARMGIDRRTLAQLEKGSPQVSIGVFFQALGVLGLLRGIEEVVKPENDIDAIALSVRRVRSRQSQKKKIDSKKVDF